MKELITASIDAHFRTDVNVSATVFSFSQRCIPVGDIFEPTLVSTIHVENDCSPDQLYIKYFPVHHDEVDWGCPEYIDKSIVRKADQDNVAAILSRHFFHLHINWETASEQLQELEEQNTQELWEM